LRGVIDATQTDDAALLVRPFVEIGYRHVDGSWECLW